MADNSAAKSLITLKKAIADAQRELVSANKKGHLPRMKENIEAYLTKSAALAKTLQDEMKQTFTTLKKYQEALTDVEAACSDWSDAIMKNDFGLKKDGGNEEHAMNKVRYNLTDVLQDIALGSKGPRQHSSDLQDALGIDLTSF
jgi:hypothetical protein